MFLITVRSITFWGINCVLMKIWYVISETKVKKEMGVMKYLRVEVNGVLSG